MKMFEAPLFRTLVAVTLLIVSSWPASAVEVTPTPGEVELTEWQDLMPPDWRPTPLDFSSFFHDPSAGASSQTDFDAPVVEALHDKLLALEGWLVPLAYERAERYHEFLLVPYFGACYHAPPPPSNQIVHVTITDGVIHEDLYEPQRVTGRLQVAAQMTDLAAAAYSMVDAKSEIADW